MPALPSCFSILNLAHFENLNDAIANAKTPEELQEIINKAFADLGMLESNIQSQLNKLNPVLSLLTAPTADLSKIVTWITDFITEVLTPYVAPIATMETQLVQLAAEVVVITNAINQAITRIEQELNITVNITIPPVAVTCSL